MTSFAAGEIGEIYLAYTHFKNTVSHEPKLLKLLPVEYDAEAGASTEGADALMNFEPEDVEALDMIIPKYISSLIYGALMEAAASENGARMQAMDNATSNAEDMISDLSLKYNRARQGSITQELTEIIFSDRLCIFHADTLSLGSKRSGTKFALKRSLSADVSLRSA